MQYIIYGYVFLSSYYWISFKDNKDLKNIIIKSVAVSYLLKTIYKLVYGLFPFAINNDLLLVVLAVLLSVILGLAIGKIVTLPQFNFILHKLHVGRSANENIWDDVIRDKTWLRIYMKDGSSYLGQYRYGEPFKREPIILLATWQKLDAHANIVLDYVKCKNEFILVNTKDFEKIEVTYAESELKIINGTNKTCL